MKLSLGPVASSILLAMGTAEAVICCADDPAPATDLIDAAPPPDSAIALPSPDAAPPPQCGKDVWCAVTLPTSPVSLNGVWGAAPDDVWIVGSPDFTMHWDGNAFATGKTNSSQTLFGIWGSGKSDVWTFSAGNALWHSAGWTAAGPAWASFDGGSGRDGGGSGFPTPIAAMSGASATDIWAVGPYDGDLQAPTVWHADGWKSGAPIWQYVPTSADAPPLAEPFSFNAVYGDDSEVWIVGMGGKTRIGKRSGSAAPSWQTVDSMTSQDLYAVWGMPMGDVWAAGAGGTVRRFTRTGDTLSATVASLPTEANLYALTGSAADDIWGAGEGGTVVHWDGKAWSVVDVPSNGRDLYAIWRAANGELWAVGRNLLLYKGSAALPGRSP